MQDKRKLINDLIFEVTGVCVETAPDDATMESLGLDVLNIWDIQEECISRFSILADDDLRFETTIEDLIKSLESVDFTGAC